MSISSLLVRGLKKGRWIWNDVTNDLQFEGLIKEKKAKKKKETQSVTAINGLTYAALKVDLKFKSNVNELELMNFRRFLREQNQGRIDSIVTIQDCKIVAIFLCIQKLPKLFHKFYNLLSVNQLLRACIVYIQFFLQAREKIAKTQHYLRGNPLSPGRTSTYQALKKDLDDLRVLIGRFYAAIIFGEFDLSDISRTDEIMLFECFFRVSTIVVWIALERKFLSVITVELGRIFRTGYFNNFSADETANILHPVKEENHIILYGKIADIDKRKSRVPSRLTSNSPVIHNFLAMDEPKLIMIGTKDFESLQDDKLRFLTKFIFLPETEIQDGVNIGILGLHRRLFDSLLYPCSKRILKLLVTGSPMDISEDRKKLREVALKKSHRESDTQTPLIFDDSPKIHKHNQYSKSVVQIVVKNEDEESPSFTHLEGEEENEESLFFESKPEEYKYDWLETEY